MPFRYRTSAASLGACVLASGIAALSDEILFTRSLALFLGQDGHASLVVLLAFMGGLALGNAWLGRMADRWSGPPLALFALLELLIGGYALGFPVVVAWARRAYVLLAGDVDASSPALFGLKFAVAVLCVLPVTILMGGTLPALIRSFSREESGLERGIARCYALNSLGGAVGCLLADFLLIPTSGLKHSLGFAAAMNCFAAVVSFSVRNSFGLARHPADRPDRSRPTPLPDSAKDRENLNRVLGVAALSGSAAMVYEVAWMRLLALCLGSTAHAFSLMLAAFILGLAAGSAWIARRAGQSSRWECLQRLQLAIGGWVTVSLPFYGMLPYWFGRASAFLKPDPTSYPVHLLLQATVCLIVMFPAAFLMGAVLPVATRLATPRLSSSGTHLGRVFAWNTIGAVVGAGVTGLILLPRLGLAGVFGVGIGINLAAAILSWHPAPSQVRSSWRFGLRSPAGRMASVVFVLVVGPLLSQRMFSESWNRSLTLGLWRNPGSVSSLQEFGKVMDQYHLLFHRDGSGSTVSINGWNDGSREQLNLRVNGKPDASTSGDMATQLLLGHLPMILHEGASRALVVGLGSGITSGAMLLHPSLKKLETVEISPEVADAARLFSSWNHQVLSDSRMRLAIEDARSYLERGRARYDVIVSEPSNPWMSGVAGLFTQEFYQDCRSHLAPGGLMVQWVHLYDNRQEALDMVVGTLATVFPRISVWQSQPRDLILIASIEPQGTNLQAVLARAALPEVQSSLDSIGLGRPVTLLARELIDDSNGRWIADSKGEVQTDDRPQLEYLAQAGFFAHQEAVQWLELDQNLSSRASTHLASYLRDHSLSTDDYRSLMHGHLAYGLPGDRVLRSIRVRWQGDSTSTGQLDLFPQLPPLGTVAELEALRLANLRQEILGHADTQRELARYYLGLLTQIYRSQRSVFLVPPARELRAVAERMVEVDPENRALHQLLLAELAWDHGDVAASVELGRTALSSLSSGDWFRLRQHPGFARAVARHLEALTELGANREALQIGEKVRAVSLDDPILNAVCRKLEPHR